MARLNLRRGSELVLPSVNTVIEPWLAGILPAGSSMHVARMLMPDVLTPEGVIEMDRIDGMRAVSQIRSCRPSSIIYACVASSVIQGVDYDRHLVAEIAEATNLPCETAIGATVAAMHVFGLRRIGVVSPYSKKVDAAEHSFLESSGFQIAASANFDIGNAFDLSVPSARDIVEAGLAIADEADGLLLSCMNMRSQAAVSELERRLDRPVIASTTATAWAALRLAGIRQQIAGLGRLGSMQWQGR
ncbi:MAG: hypothetical protein QM744_08670 [Mesorhizobium sp.]